MDRLPPPLNVVETNELIDKMLAGDRLSFEKLYEHNLRLVYFVTKKFNCTCDKDDLFSVGAFGLLKALQTYDKNKGKISGYSIKCITNEILMFLRKNKKNKNEISLETVIGNSKNGDEILLKDRLIDGDINIEDDYIKKRLEKT